MICGRHTLSFNEWLYFAQSKWKYKNSKQQIKEGGENKISSRVRVHNTQQRQLEQPNSDSKGDVIKWGPTNGITSNQLGTLSPQLDIYLPILIAVLLCPDKQQWPLSPAATVYPPAILKDVKFLVLGCFTVHSLSTTAWAAEGLICLRTLWNKHAWGWNGGGGKPTLVSLSVSSNSTW